jgi:hypothetical protein
MHASNVAAVASACAAGDEGGEEGEDEDSTGSPEGETDGGGDKEATPLDGAAMSAAHAIGLAKLPHVLEWLRHALGSRSGSSGGNGGAAGPKFLVFAHHRRGPLLLPFMSRAIAIFLPGTTEAGPQQVCMQCTASAALE